MKYTGKKPYGINQTGTGSIAVSVENVDVASFTSGSLDVSGSLIATTFTASTALINGDVRIKGTASVDVLITSYESSSIIYSSGSTKFGDTLDDTHQFTGSVYITSSLDVTGGITGSLFGTASYVPNLNEVTTAGNTTTNAVSIGTTATPTSSLDVFKNNAGNIQNGNDSVIIKGNNPRLKLLGTSAGSTSGDGVIQFSTEDSGDRWVVIGGNSFVIGRGWNNNKTTLLSISNSAGGNTAASVFLANANSDSRFSLGFSGTNGTPLSGFTGNGKLYISSTGLATPTAMLHVKGSGTTSSTAAFRVENANASASLEVLDDGLVNIPGGGKLNFNNQTAVSYITTAGGGTGLGSRSIQIPGTGGNDNWRFYNTTGRGIRLYDQTGDTLTITPGNTSTTDILSISKSAASGYGGGTFIRYQSILRNRIYTFGNPNSERNDEPGVHTKIVAGAGGSAGSGTFGNGGNIYLDGGTPAYAVNNPGYILISTEVTGSKVGIGTSSPTYTLDVSGSGNFTDNLTVTGSLTVSGSSTLTNIGPAVFSGSLVVTEGITGSLFGTSSYALEAITASYALYAVSASYEIIKEESSSFADTASYVNPLVQDVIITGSLNVTSSTTSIISVNNKQFQFKDGGSLDAILSTNYNNFRIKGNNNDGLYINLGGYVSTTKNFSVGNEYVNSNVPPARLTVKGSGTTSSTTALLVENANASASLAVNDAGNVLIGTTADAGYKLDVNGTFRFLLGSGIYFRGNSSAIEVVGAYLFVNKTSGVSFYAYQSVFRDIIRSDSAGGNVLKLGDTQERMRISGGNVGIGTTSPSYTLDVSGSGNFTDGLTITGSLTVSGSSTLTNIGPAVFSGSLTVADEDSLIPVNIIRNDSSSTLPVKITNNNAGGRSGLTFSLPNNNNQAYSIGVDNDRSFKIGEGSLGSNTKLTITLGGNLGIGTTSPTARLQVKGSGTTSATTAFRVEDASGIDSMLVLDDGKIAIGANASVISNLDLSIKASTAIIQSTTTNMFLYLKAGDNNYTTGIRAQNSTGDENWKLQGNNSGTTELNVTTGNLELSTTADKQITFKTLNTERLRITGAGNVGIGTINPAYTLDVQSPTQTGTGTDFSIFNVGYSNSTINKVTGSAFLVSTTANSTNRYSTTVRIGGGSDTSAHYLKFGEGDANGLRLDRANSTLGIFTVNGVYISNANTNITPSARLQIKGSGTTSSTTSLLVQNSSGQSYLQVVDSGVTSIGKIGDGELQIYSGNYRTYAVAASNKLEFQDAYGVAGAINSTGLVLTSTYDPSPINRLDVAGRVFIGSTIAAASASLHISSSLTGSTPAVLIQKSGSTVLDVQGSQGQLFSVVDSLTGSLMSVNDISGLPILEVFSDDRVEMGTYGAPGLIVTGSSITATGSFTGSFIGDGSGLINIPASGITGLNLSQIATGSVSASVSTDSGSFTVTSGSTNLLFVSSSGNVGIGTTTPTRTLSVNGQIIVPNSNGYYSKTTGGSELSILLLDSSNNFQYGSVFAGASSIFYTATTFDWYQYPAGVAAQRMRLSINGNLLIGTNTDNARLQVKGLGTTSATTALRVENANASASLVVRDDGRVGIGTTNPGRTLHVLVADNDEVARFTSTQGNDAYIQFQSNTSVTLPRFGIVNNDFIFIPSGSETIRFAHNGNVGIGTTTLTSRLQVKGSGTTSATTAFLVENANASASLTVLDNGNVYSNGPGFIASNTAFGFQSLNNPSGSAIQNSAFGYQNFVNNNYSGYDNVAIGYRAIQNATTGYQNMGIGTETLQNLTTGLANTAVGHSVLRHATANAGNTGIGYYALYTLGANQGNDNTGIGRNAFQLMTTGSSNIGIGGGSSAFRSGSFNIFIGSGTHQIITGSGNVIIGNNQTLLSSSLDNTIAISDGSGNMRIYVSSSGNVGIGTTSPTYALDVSGSGNFTDGLTVTGSTSIIGETSIYKSGSTVFQVQGSQGELFAITDSLSGSLFSVSNISGLPIMEVFSDNTTLMGDYLAPALMTTKRLTANSGSTVIYSIPTASYDGAFFEYTIKSGSNARAGQIFSTYLDTTASYTDNSTSDIGDTTGFIFGVILSGSNMVLTGSASTDAWTVKTIIRSI